MISQATSVLDIPELSTKAKTAYQFNRTKQPLLPVPLLADDGCKINLTADNIEIVKDNKIILKGKRDKVSTLWMIPIKHHKRKNYEHKNYQQYQQYMQPTVHIINQQ
jgi:hypothetical protein